MIPGITISAFDYRTASTDALAELHAFVTLLIAEARPEDPVPPFELFEASIRNIPDFIDIFAWQARVDGRLIGQAQGGIGRTGENEHLVQTELDVLPPHRGQGIGRRLLGEIADLAERENRNLVLGSTSERVPAGAAFAERIGATPGMDVHTNRLALADADRDLIDRWIAAGPAQAPGYSLVTIDGEIPDEELPAVVDVIDVMNDAPHDDIDFEDEHMTPEQWRQIEKGIVARGTEHWMLLARHDATGVYAGFTDVTYNPSMPETVHQLGTAVRPEHRGHGLGKWLKAVMLRRIIDTRTDAIDIRTGNANSNDAMLAINRQLGFEPYIARRFWQVELEQVRKYLTGAATTAT